MVQSTSLVRFSYLFCLCNFCNAPRDMRKFLQKCQKTAECWGRTVYVRNLQSPRHLAHPLWNDLVYTSRVNHSLTQLAPVPPPEVLTSALSRSSCWKRQDKVLEAVLQSHVATDHGWLVILSRPGRSREGMSQVSRRSEVAYINGAPSIPGCLLALLRELSQCPRALT